MNIGKVANYTYPDRDADSGEEVVEDICGGKVTNVSIYWIEETSSLEIALRP